MEKLKMRQAPCVYACDGNDGKNLNIEIDLPEVKKEDIVLKFTENTFSVKARSDDTEYLGNYTTCCPVDSKKAVATFKDDRLIVTVPYKKPHQEMELKID